MKIQLTQSEIETAVREYVASQGIKVEGKNLTVDFSMTRGEAGLLADLVIEDAKPVEAKTTTKRAAGQVNSLPKENTIGSAIAKQGEKPAATTAAEAIAEAQAAAKADSAAKSGDDSAAVEQAEGAGAADTGEQVTEEVVAKETKTTSLFG